MGNLKSSKKYIEKALEIYPTYFGFENAYIANLYF